MLLRIDHLTRGKGGFGRNQSPGRRHLRDEAGEHPAGRRGVARVAGQPPAQALADLLRRHRANAAASTDPNLLPAIDQANKDAEARLGNDAEAREQLRRHLGAAP